MWRPLHGARLGALGSLLLARRRWIGIRSESCMNRCPICLTMTMLKTIKHHWQKYYQGNLFTWLDLHYCAYLSDCCRPSFILNLAKIK
ncbi:hypothetical protein PVAP13_5KG301514 [Panicum virgatum]|uniref:Secreted protein n=1 Tax=Panicum virgatum TaxID=38727 RepID=A0A8T0SHG0_PANVG|nr:hypothetical protein PVAP13_5KG301514 [Panicum virgatum]